MQCTHTQMHLTVSGEHCANNVAYLLKIHLHLIWKSLVCFQPKSNCGWWMCAMSRRKFIVTHNLNYRLRFRLKNKNYVKTYRETHAHTPILPFNYFFNASLRVGLNLLITYNKHCHTLKVITLGWQS